MFSSEGHSELSRHAHQAAGLQWGIWSLLSVAALIFGSASRMHSMLHTIDTPQLCSSSNHVLALAAYPKVVVTVYVTACAWQIRVPGIRLMCSMQWQNRHAMHSLERRFCSWQTLVVQLGSFASCYKSNC
jgi:hypothetical protein